MKNALIKDTLREIKHSFGRFLSIFLIVALGCGFFSGIKATMPDMVSTSQTYFRENNLMDMKLMSTIGVKSQDVEAVKKADNVKGAAASYSKEVFYFYNNQNLVLKCLSFNDTLKDDSKNKMNKPVVVEGRLPENDGECAVEVKMSSPDTFKIGETLKFAEPDTSKNLSETLANEEYKIVGIVASPLYIGYERDAASVGNGTVVSNVFLREEEFVCDYYTEMYITLDGIKTDDIFSDEYRDEVKKLSAPAVKSFEDSVNSRYEKLVSDANAKIETSQSTVDTLESILSANGTDLKSLKQEADKSVKSAQKSYDSQQDGSASQLLAKSALLKAQQAQTITAELLDDYNSGSDSAYKKYTKQLEDAKAQIQAANYQLSNQQEPAFYTFDRFEASTDYSSFYGDSQKVDSISKIFPVFFILVAALVCLTTMTRMVEEQRIQIGTYKALGYSSAKIASKFLIYSAVAATAGSCIGTVIGLQLFPRIIYSCYKIMYNIPSIDVPFKPWYLVACWAVSVLCTCSAVLYACISELRSVPSALMRPKPPHNGKRVLIEKIGFIWNRLSFLTKVTMRNLFRYKKRFAMTVIGVAGCTALIVTGFGLKYSIKTIADKQFNEVFVYDGLLVLNTSDYSFDQLEEKVSSINEIGKHMLAHMDEGTAENNGALQTVSFFVPYDESQLDNYIHLRDADTSEKLNIEDGTVIITQKLASLLDVGAGDTFKAVSDGKTAELKIAAVTVNYASHYIYMNRATYCDYFNNDPTFNIGFVNLKEDTDEDSFKSELISNNEFYGLTYKTDSSKGFLNSVDSLDAIVVLLIVCAGLLAVVVLYNLANINITERVREIATVKVLGFYDNETSDYICRENYISAVIGILIGFAAGKILHYFVVITAEVDLVMFNRTLVWWAYALGAVMTFAFTALVNLLLHFKLKKVDMVESLKSVE